MKYLNTFKLFESTDPYIELKKIILNQCYPFVELSKSCITPLMLWRGTSQKFIRENGKEVGKLVYEINHIKNRNPVDTPLILHDKLNTEFEKKFGWKVRNGVFCTTDKGWSQTHASISSSKTDGFDYPEPYLFVPIGNFKYCWSPKYRDLTADIKVKNNDWNKEMINLSDIKIKNIVKSYKDSDIQDAHFNSKKDANEISFYCDKYLLISQR